MILLIVLTILTICGISLILRDYQLIGSIIFIVFCVLLITHIYLWSFSSYQYELYVEERNKFERTLKCARENGHECEIAPLLKELIKWNVELNEYKKNNKFIFYDLYIDDRYELLQPIK